MKFSVCKKIFWSLVACALLVGVASAAVSDPDFIELCKEGSFQQMVYAIKGGANVNARNKSGLTPLMYAAGNNPDPEVLNILLGAGADPKAKDEYERMAIDYAKNNEKLVNTDAFWKLNDASY